MQGIFYDLETSDRHSIGQILNYSFIHVDSALKPLSELSGSIKVSRLQLPRASAILINRIDILEHQRNAQDDEPSAMKKVVEYLCGINQSAREPVALIGYNSSRFDLGFLRTSITRNGLNPYAWKGRIVDKDLLLAARKLSTSCPDFPRSASRGGESDKLSLGLETLCSALGVLKGAQSHESRADVLLCIELARYFREHFNLDALSYSAYEALDLDSQQREPVAFAFVEPNYDLNSKALSSTFPATLICANQSYGLWVNLQKYSEGVGRGSLFLGKKNGGALLLGDSSKLDRTWNKVAAAAQAEFKSLNLTNYFTPTVCDIEQFIYRLDFDARAALSAAIWEGSQTALSRLKNNDAKALYLRHRLRSHTWGTPEDAQIEKNLKTYALRRYGGKVLLAVHDSESGADEDNERFHPTWAKLMGEIDEALVSGTPEDKALMRSLKRFYEESDICRVAREALEAPIPQTAPVC